jgi:hypothetical protein
MRNVLKICVLSIAMWSGSQVALSQQPTAQITGLVTDTSGSAVPGAQIQILNVNTGLRKSIALDQRQGASPDGGSSPGYCPFEERARDLGRQTSTASTGRRGLAWADSVG